MLTGHLLCARHHTGHAPGGLFPFLWTGKGGGRGSGRGGGKNQLTPTALYNWTYVPITLSVPSKNANAVMLFQLLHFRSLRGRPLPLHKVHTAERHAQPATLSRLLCPFIF